MDLKNIRMIKYWYILFLICETVLIQALKHSHLVRIISGFQALCTARYDTGVAITYVCVTARQTYLTTCSKILKVVFIPKYFVVPSFLGGFAKPREITSSFVMSVCPSVRMEQLGTHWTNFQETLIFWCFSNMCPENSISIIVRQE